MLARALGVAVRPEADPRGAHRGRAGDADERDGVGRWPRSPAAGVAVGDFSLGQPSLDEVFLALTGRHRRSAARRTRSRHDSQVEHAGSDPDGRRRRRPGRAAAAGPVAASLAFGWRVLLKVKHVPEQLLDVTITIPVMFTLMFTYLFGGALAGSTERLPAVPAARHRSC